MLPVVILCGGRGSRLQPVTEECPKPLVPVGDRPFLSYVLERLEREDVTEVVLSTGYLAEQVDAFVERSDWNFSLRCIEEEEPLGTGGALRFVAEEAGLDAFIAINGDTLFEGSIHELLQFHETRPDAAASIALVQTDDPERYGRVRVDEATGRIRGFDEKQAGVEGTVWINAGVYVLEPVLWRSIEGGTMVSLEREAFPEWVDRGLYGCRFPDANFLDIGTPEDYRKAEEWLNQN